VTDHPTLLDLEGFAFDTIPPEQARGVILHLLSGCGPCQAAVAPYLGRSFKRSSLTVELDAAYDAAMDRALQAVQNRRLAEARAFVAAIPLEALDEGFAEAPAHLESPMLMQALVERSQTLRYENPAEMVRLARFAAIFTRLISAERYSQERVTNLHFFALTELANAYRVADTLDEAQQVLNRATDLLGKVSDPLLRARFFIVQADIDGSNRRYAPALDTLDLAYVSYMRHGEIHLAGRTLIKKAMYVGYGGDPQGAIDLLQEGIASVDEPREPSLVASAFQNLVYWLTESGRFREARLGLWEVRKRSQFLTGRINELKIRWLEGRISAGLGELDRAERDLLYAKEGFAEAGLRYKEALAGVELGVVRLVLKRHDEAETGILQSLDVFEELGISYEVKRAVSLLRFAFEEKMATVGIIERFIYLLRRSEYDPNARF